MPAPRAKSESAASAAEARWILWGYVLQCAGLLVPLLLVASPLYVWIVRGRVAEGWLSTHLRWQRDTALVVAAAVLAMMVMLVFDAVLAGEGVTYAGDWIVLALGLAIAVPLWVVYRIARGMLKYVKRLPPRGAAG